MCRDAKFSLHLCAGIVIELPLERQHIFSFHGHREVMAIHLLWERGIDRFYAGSLKMVFAIVGICLQYKSGEAA